MSFPSIPGYIEPHSGDSLADQWAKPSVDFPVDLWPLSDLASIRKDPAHWVTIEEHFFTDEKHGGRGCVLVQPSDAAQALEDTTWIGRDLGKFGVWDDGTCDTGLVESDRNVSAEFFVTCRRPSGADLPCIEVSLPFLWYWDAFPVSSGWKYVNRAGREQELIRYERTTDSWKVEVRALELRNFLATYGRVAMMQIDYCYKIDANSFPRVDDEFRNEWAHFDFCALHERDGITERPAFSMLMGQYLISGLKNSRMPRFEERRRDHVYPDFIYGLDAETGMPLTHTCDPSQLGTYFDKDNSRLHYLTPIYFKREVLQPYASQPNRYRLSSSRLSCLDLWGVDISINTAGLVEVYLGDLGRDLPNDEWGHWRSHNVPPDGEMDEGRFRRDFLNQWASSKDVVRDLRKAREKAASVSKSLLGSPIWRPLPSDIMVEFDSLVGPLTNDPVALGPPFLVLTKVLVDAIDPAVLKSQLPTVESGEKSLKLLQRYAQQLGDTEDLTAILRALQGFRSRAGVAHLPGSGERAKAIAALGIEDLSNVEAFEFVVVRLAACLTGLTELMSARLPGRGIAPEATSS